MSTATYPCHRCGEPMDTEVVVDIAVVRRTEIGTICPACAEDLYGFLHGGKYDDIDSVLEYITGESGP